MAFYFQNLIVWQKSFLLSKKIHECTKHFPRDEQYILIDQMRRASLSIVSNIAEGSGRGTESERKHFLHIAKGSCMEFATQALLAQEFGYMVTSQVMDEIIGLIEEITKMLYAMIKNHE